jgi:outer membrane protein
MRSMKRLLAGMMTVLFLAGGAASQAQEKPPKVGIINIQIAIAQSNDGQKAAKEIQDRFAPKRSELEKSQSEITALQDQLKNQEKTLSDDARNKLLRSIDDKTRVLNRNQEDATNEFQAAEQDAINEIGQKLMNVLSQHAQKNGFSLVLDVSSPQTPVLYADSAIDITKEIIDLYNQASAKPAAGAAPAAVPASKPAASAAPAAPAAPAAAPKPAAPAAGTKPAGTP